MFQKSILIIGLFCPTFFFSAASSSSNNFKSCLKSREQKRADRIHFHTGDNTIRTKICFAGTGSDVKEAFDLSILGVIKKEHELAVAARADTSPLDQKITILDGSILNARKKIILPIVLCPLNAKYREASEQLFHAQRELCDLDAFLNIYGNSLELEAREIIQTKKKICEISQIKKSEENKLQNDLMTLIEQGLLLPVDMNSCERQHDQERALSDRNKRRSFVIAELNKEQTLLNFEIRQHGANVQDLTNRNLFVNRSIQSIKANPSRDPLRGRAMLTIEQEDVDQLLPNMSLAQSSQEGDDFSEIKYCMTKFYNQVLQKRINNNDAIYEHVALEISNLFDESDKFKGKIPLEPFIVRWNSVLQNCWNISFHDRVQRQFILQFKKPASGYTKKGEELYRCNFERLLQWNFRDRSLLEEYCNVLREIVMLIEQNLIKVLPNLPSKLEGMIQDYAAEQTEKIRTFMA